MMSLRNWVLLLAAYIAYLLIGGFSFRALERKACDEKVNRNDFFLTKVKRFYVRGNFSTEDSARLFEILGDSSDECSKWDFYNSFVFSFTASTTIGYGQLSPVTWGGKLLCIFYSLIGIPINGILIGSLGTYFASKLRTNKKDSEKSSLMYITLDVMVYLIPGIAIFMLLPAAIFSKVERWTYFDSLYFTFISLTTIGFGDFAAGRNPEVMNEIGIFRHPYEVFIIVWIIFGLGYVFMIITIISDGLRSPVRKAVKRIEKAFMTKIIREILLMKWKNLDEKQKPKLYRLSSEPILKMNNDEKRLNRSLSLTNLHHVEDTDDEFDDEDDDTEFNNDTVKSLRQLFERSRKISRLEITDSTLQKPFRRSVSVQQAQDTVTKTLKADNVRKRRSSAQSHSINNKSHASSIAPLSDFLKTTTLEDFLLAAENVEKHDHIEEHKNGKHDPGTFNNRIRKLSNLATAGLEPITKFLGSGPQRVHPNITGVENPRIVVTHDEDEEAIYGAKE